MMAIYIPLSAQTNETKKGEDLVGTPDYLLTKFSHDYPQTVDTKWVFIDDAYVVEYTTAEEGNHKVWYNKSGEKQKEMHELNLKAELPEPVKEALSNRYAAFEVKNVTQETERGITSYRITLDEKGTQKVLVSNGDGKIVEKDID